MLVRYFIEQVFRYDLEIIAGLGVDESSRSKVNFSIIQKKRNQAHTALLSIFSMDPDDINCFIDNKVPENPILSIGEFPNSMIPFLKNNTIYKHALIVTYLSSLKIICLYVAVKNQSIDNKTAYIIFSKFIREELNCIPAIVQSFALHLFGGCDYLKKIIFPKRNLPINKKLHKILSGSIDLLLPSLSQKLVEQTYPLHVSRKLTTVFATTDQRISLLHSLMNEKIRLDSGEKINYSRSINQIDLLPEIKWSKSDLDEFDHFTNEDVGKRFSRPYSGPQKFDHLLHLVPHYENEVLKYQSSE
ncbi:hypothetical protein C9994_00200 [Marivirga lumbricoides]|uniref:Uncharacterized protein n=1 Tax=Marivirga lumbricoides TaxID=1046115 RepID=A0A2T4DW28_9BACT|nr:hypothetical protein C9994_00200 [Marivirga lumbricoides]